MNNEEKILSMLETMQGQMNTMQTRLDKMDARFDGIDSRLDKMDVRLDGMDSRFDSMDSRFDRMDSRFDALTEEVTKLRLHIENVTDRNISLLLESYTPNTEKLNIVAEKVEGLTFDVANLKTVVMSHSKDINYLMERDKKRSKK